MAARSRTERPLVKFHLPKKRGADPVQILTESGFEPRSPVIHQDTWFERPEGRFLGSLVLRHVLPDGPWRMAWETTIHTGPDAERHHLWTVVDGPAMWKRLERLGMKPVLTLQATRVPLDKGNQHVAIERMPKMGDFLEVPADKNREPRREYSSLLQKLGAVEPELRSYRDLASAPAFAA